MGLGKILGSISPAFGMLSGKGLFGHLPLNAMGQSGLGGILGMLLSHGGHGGGDQGQPQQQTDTSAVYPGIDPMLTQGPAPGGYAGGMGAMSDRERMMGGMGSVSDQERGMMGGGPRFGRFGSDLYFGGQNPIGQNAIGKFLGGMFR